MHRLRKLLKKEEKDYVICPKCGAGYNTDMVSMAILAKSPFMRDLSDWRTRIVCKMCRTEFWVSGSHSKVFGQQKPS